MIQHFQSNGSEQISLNTSKTEIVIIRPKHKIITKHLNFRIIGEKINLSTTVKYLGVILHELSKDLEQQGHINFLLIKLNRAAGLLSKIWHYVPKFHLKSSFCSQDIQIFVFSSSHFFFPVSHCFRGSFKKNLKFCDIMNYLNKNLITHFV